MEEAGQLPLVLGVEAGEPRRGRQEVVANGPQGEDTIRGEHHDLDPSVVVRRLMTRQPSTPEIVDDGGDVRRVAAHDDRELAHVRRVFAVEGQQRPHAALADP
jgi:hypothetical protein